MNFSQLARASDDVCRGESVDCRKYYTVRRIDGKCNNLKSQETKNWGATAIGMRRLTSPAYGEPDKPDLHMPRQVLILVLSSTWIPTRWQLYKILDGSCSGGWCEPTRCVKCDAQDDWWYEAKHQGFHSHDHAVWTVPWPWYHPHSRRRLVIFNFFPPWDILDLWLTTWSQQQMFHSPRVSFLREPLSRKQFCSMGNWLYS